MTAEADALAVAPWAAMAWHGGQWSALYAYASSGTMMPGLAPEARRAADLAEAEADTIPDADLGLEYLQDVDALRALARAADAAEVTQ